MQINQTTDRTKILQKLMSLTVVSPEQVKVSETQLRDSVEFFVACADHDYGKLVGKQGNNVKAWWAICDAAALKDLGTLGKIIVKTPQNKTPSEPQKFQFNPAFTDEVLKKCLMELSSLMFERGVVDIKSPDQSQSFVTITVHGYLNPVVNQGRLEEAIDRVVGCIGNANGRHVKTEVDFKVDE